MYNLERFHQEIKARLRDTYLPDGSRATQSELAKAVYLSVPELSKRLHGGKGTRLSQENIRNVVLTLTSWGALNTEVEVVELLNLVECPTFSEQEWAALPLTRLKRLDRREGNRVLSAKHNLPLALSSFIGRNQEIEQCLALLASTRLLTITGAGGVGKTRLAIEVADRLLNDELGHYANGIYLIRLDALNNGRLVAPLLATTLGLREDNTRPLQDTIADHLRDKRLLLVLDNCEHLVEATAALAETLLSRCADLGILATSCEPLLMLGETSWQLPSLSLPEAAQLTDLAAVRRSEAVSLFVKRASSVLPGWSLNSGNVAAVVEICQRLDGIPLAIELAAARVKALTVQEIAAALKQSFQVLGSGARTAVTRQQTIRASIEWSYQLLSASEQQALARLAVFSGGWDSSAAEAVCAAKGGVAATLDQLAQLLQKSLLQAAADGETMRYRMLDTIRQYAQEQLQASSEQEAISRRHLDYYLQLAEAAVPGLRGPEMGAWLNRLEREHDNLRTAIGGALARGEAEAALRLTAALYDFWDLRGYASEGRRWLDAALQISGEVGESVRAGALFATQVLARRQGDYVTAAAHLAQCMTLRRASGDEKGIASALVSMGILASVQGDFTTARQHFVESLSIARKLGDKPTLVTTVSNWGAVALAERDYPAARSRFEEALALATETGDRRFIIYTLVNLGSIAFYQGDYTAARPYFVQGLKMQQDLGDRQGVPDTLIWFAELYGAQGQEARADRLAAAAEALCEEMSMIVSSGRRADYETHIRAARLILGEAEFAAIWIEGRSISMEQAIAYGLEEDS